MGLRLISHSFVFSCILCIQLAVRCGGRVVRMDDRDSSIAYSPGWTPNGDPSDYLMTTTQTSVLGSMMVLPFEGTRISIFGSVVAFAYGQAPSALFTIDDDPVGGDYIQSQPSVMINNESEVPSQQLLFASPELPPGPHVLTVTILDVPGANTPFVFDYAEYESLDLLSLSASDTTLATPASTPSPQAARFGENVDNFGVPSSLPLALDASKTQVNSIEDATTTVQPSPSPAPNDSASITSVSYSNTSSNMQPTALSSTTTMSATVSSPSSITIASSISSTTNQIALNARHILPLVVGIVITCLFLFLFAIGAFHPSRRVTRRNLRDSRYSYSSFDGFPFRRFDTGASMSASRDSDHILLTPLPTPPASGHLSDHPRTPSRPVSHTEAFLFLSRGTPHTMLPSSPMTPTWSSISNGFNGTPADGPSGSRGQDQFFNEHSVDAYGGRAPPPYRVRQSLSKLDAV